MEYPISAFDVYFGSVPVEFAPVEGVTSSFVLDDWTEDSTPEGVARALARNFPQSPGDGAPADVVEAAIPALDIVLRDSRSPSSGPPLPAEVRHERTLPHKSHTTCRIL